MRQSSASAVAAGLSERSAQRAEGSSLEPVDASAPSASCGVVAPADAGVPPATIQSTLTGPPTAGAARASSGSSPSAPRPVLGRRRQARSRPIPRRPTPSSRSSAPASAAATPSRTRQTASGAPSSRPRPRPKWWPRGSSGASATTSRRSIYLAEWTGRQGDLAEPAAAGAVPRDGRRTSTGSTPTAPGRTTTTRSSARAQLNGLLVLQAMLGNSDLKDDAERDLHAHGAVRRGARAGTSRAISARPSAAPASLDRAARRSASLRADTVHHRRRQGGYVRFDYRGRHKALFEHITPADVRWICQRLSRAHRRAVAGRVPRRRLSRKPPPTVSSAGSSRRSPKAWQLKD